MNIFLTSQASNVLEKIAPMLPKQPSEYKVVFIPTAARPYGANVPWMDKDRDELIRRGFSVEDLELDTISAEEVEQKLANVEVIFVAGGNTFYLLEHAKRTGFDAQVRKAVAEGKIYIGSSAGSVLAAPDIKYVEKFDDPEEADLQDTRGLALVPFSILPHADNPKYKELHEEVLSEYEGLEIVPTSDNQFLVPDGDRWEVITV